MAARATLAQQPPAPTRSGPTITDQVNLTDEESRIMRVAGGGFEQSCNAQAVVAAESMLVVAQDVVQDANDKRQVAPMVQKLSALPKMLGKPQTLLADNGYFSEANVSRCEAAKIAPLISLGRERHHLGWKERFGEARRLQKTLRRWRQWRIGWRQEKANGCMLCASRYRNRCSVSSNR